MKLGISVFKSVGSGISNGIRFLNIACPVDVVVKDTDGNILAAIEGHEGDSIGEDIFALGDGSGSYIGIPEGKEYDLVITGTDDGSMTILSLFTPDGDSINAASMIEDIPVTKGEVFTAHVKSSFLEGLVIYSSSGAVYRMQPGRVPIDADHFSDPVFSEYLLETWDRDGDENLDRDEIADIEHIRLSIYETWVEDGFVTQEEANYIIGHWQNRIASLDGIQYFTHLRWLDAFDMPLMGGTLDFKNNMLLESLNLWNSGLTGITLGNLPELKSIHCEENTIGTLDVSQCPALV